MIICLTFPLNLVEFCCGFKKVKKSNSIPDIRPLLILVVLCCLMNSKYATDSQWQSWNQSCSHNSFNIGTSQDTIFDCWSCSISICTTNSILVNDHLLILSTFVKICSLISVITVITYFQCRVFLNYRSAKDVQWSGDLPLSKIKISSIVSDKESLQIWPILTT